MAGGAGPGGSGGFWICSGGDATIAGRGVIRRQGRRAALFLPPACAGKSRTSTLGDGGVVTARLEHESPARSRMQRQNAKPGRQAAGGFQSVPGTRIRPLGMIVERQHRRTSRTWHGKLRDASYQNNICRSDCRHSPARRTSVVDGVFGHGVQGHVVRHLLDRRGGLGITRADIFAAAADLQLPAGADRSSRM